MKLRTRILLVLLAFALLPLLVTMVTNFPRVLDLLSSLQQRIYLQELRADFGDLDQHLSSRQEMLKLLAKLPEPGVVLGKASALDNLPAPEESDDQPEGSQPEGYSVDAGTNGLNQAQNEESSIDIARTHYTEWINRILPDQLDSIEIQFLDENGNLRFWLERNFENRIWTPTIKPPVTPNRELVQKALLSRRPEVYISKVRLQPALKQSDPRRFMNLHLISPVGFVPEVGATGVVVMTVDIGGMARAFNQTLWAYDDGRYLEVSRQADNGSTAFKDFPGIEKSFPKGQQFLWRGKDAQQILWVPLIQTESSGPLWVGRVVDDSPVEDFGTQLMIRVGGFVLALMIIAWMVARWMSLQADKAGHELTEGISRLLEDEEKVVFKWKWTDELKFLSEKLTSLANKHISNNRRLLQHTRELEESNRYKSEFLANVSHELRTPLNSILLLSKILADKQTGLLQEHAEQAKVINRAGRDLQQLIEDILDLSKIEARKTSLNLENISLLGLLQDLVSLMQPQFDEKQLTLQINVQKNVPDRINSDPDKIRQILKNFLSNAVKFTSQGGVEITLSVSDQEQTPVFVSVKDSGIGIAEDKHNLVFQAFKQADGSTSRRYGGTGLGLSISQQLAYLLGGHIELISEEGKGADFRLYLPLVFDRETIVDEQIGVDEPVLDAEQAGAADDGFDFADSRVLVLEGDMKNLLTLTTLLEDWGCKVTGAGDLDEALEAFEEESFSAVLMDVMIDAGDNYATLTRIRQDYPCDVMPIIALTSQPHGDQEKACIDNGASAYLEKPVKPAELHLALGKLLDR